MEASGLGTGVSEKTRKLQQSMSTKHFPCLPGSHTYLPRKPNYHRPQRFKVFQHGQKKGTVEDPKIELSAPLDESFRYRNRVSDPSLSSFKEVYETKQKLLHDWTAVSSQEKLMKLKENEQNVDSAQNRLQRSLSSSKSMLDLRVEPSWLKHDNEVLQFYLYYEEKFEPPSKETHRVHQCILFYYLTDNSIQIEEPKEENSGLPQGVFLKRTELTKPGSPGTLYRPNDFVVGEVNQMCGRRFHTYGVDLFTRRYFAQRGIQLAGNGVCPEDPFREQLRLRKEQKEETKQGGFVSITGARKVDTLKQYLENDLKVLRFYCVWDDTRVYGCRHQYELNYFLCDDTVEIRNVERGKNGSEMFPLLLKRQKLVKDMSNRDLGYYTYRDLKCGQFIDVFTRKLLLHSCDRFTKEYYYSELGIKQPTVTIKVSDWARGSRKVDRAKSTKSAPPYNGFGSEADSLANCVNLIPKPARQDLKKFLRNQGKVLRFVAKFTAPKPDDAVRQFVITYYMDDDSCAVYEQSGKNAGMLAGKFLERGRYKKPVKKHKAQKAVSEKTRRLQRHVQDKIHSRMVGGPFGLLRAFRQFAVNEHCMIDLNGFKIGLRSIGIQSETATDGEMAELFSLYDKTGDGQIDFQEFVDNVMGDRVVPVNDSGYSNRSFRPSDFYIGAKVRFVFPQTGACSQEFVILKATKQTLSLMENPENVREFPKSDVTVIFSRLGSALKDFKGQIDEAFAAVDKQNTGYISISAFRELLQRWATDFDLSGEDAGLSEQELLTLIRKYEKQGTGMISYQAFVQAFGAEVNAAIKATDQEELEEKTHREKLNKTMKVMLRKIHGEYDRETLLQKFQGLSKSHKKGVPFDLLMFFLKDELGVVLPSDYELMVMLCFDKDCDGLVTVEEIDQALYNEVEEGYKEKTATEFLELSDTQQSYHTNGYLEYQTVLKANSVRMSTEFSLETLMKSFSSAFFKRRHELWKNFLSFDIHRKGVLDRNTFFNAMDRTNHDYPGNERTTLLNYLFGSEKRNGTGRHREKDSRPSSDIEAGPLLDYELVLQVLFSQDRVRAVELFGEYEPE